MNKFISRSLMTLGVVFIILLLVAGGFYIAISMKSGTVPFAPNISIPTSKEKISDTTTPTQAGNTPFVLSDAQRQALSTFGIDPNTVPTSITPAQEACFTAKLGSERVSEIKSGATPTAIDFFKVKACL